MKVIFVSEDKEEWELYTKLFKAHFKKWDLVCVKGTPEAKERIQNAPKGDIGFVIVDAHVKEEEPEDIFLELTAATHHQPMLFYGTQANIKVRVPSDIYTKNPANGLILKPLDIGQFRTSITRAIRWIEDKNFENATIEVNRDDYIPIKIRNFYRFDSIPYDAYLELSKTKFVKLINKNEVYTEALIQKYMQKNVRFLYLHKTDHLNFLETQAKNLVKLFQNKQLALANVFQIQVKAASIIQEYVRTIGTTELIISLTVALIDKTVETYTLENLKDLKAVLKLFPFKNRDLAEQSVLTCYVCACLLDELGWTSDMARKKLGLASILHDCMISNEEMVNLSSLDDPKLLKFKDYEQEEFKNHPKLAAAAAHVFSGFSETDFIINQHHELPSGRGFPNKINSNQITALSCIFIIANNFVGELAKSGGISKANITETLRNFNILYNEGNFKEPLKSIAKFFK